MNAWYGTTTTVAPALDSRIGTMDARLSPLRVCSTATSRLSFVAVERMACSCLSRESKLCLAHRDTVHVPAPCNPRCRLCPTVQRDSPAAGHWVAWLRTRLPACLFPCGCLRLLLLDKLVCRPGLLAVAVVVCAAEKQVPLPADLPDCIATRLRMLMVTHALLCGCSRGVALSKIVCAGLGGLDAQPSAPATAASPLSAARPQRRRQILRHCLQLDLRLLNHRHRCFAIISSSTSGSSTTATAKEVPLRALAD